MMSITGRRPVIAAPTAIPVKPASEIGVSSTRWGPNSSTRPENFEWSARLGDVFAHDEHARIAAHLLGQRLSDGFAEREFANRGTQLSGIDILIDLVGTGIRSRESELHGLSISAFTRHESRRARGDPACLLAYEPIADEPNRIALGLPCCSSCLER